MKKLWNAYTSFNRTERMGIVALLSIIIILLVARATMHLWVKPNHDAAKEKELTERWEAFTHKNEPAIQPATVSAAKDIKPFPFDPNTVSAEALAQLGLQSKTISAFINWRNKGKRFYNKEDFKALYTLSEEDYNRLAPYITITEKKTNLNKADSATLVALPGIGAKLAHKILEYRKEIGHYTSVDQLLDVYHFPDSTMKKLRTQLVIN